MLRAALVTALAILILGAGCGSREFRVTLDPPEPRMAVAGDLVVDDIPAPRSFRLSVERSALITTSGVRSGYLVYQGVAKTSEVVQFFRMNMPASGWTLVREQTDNGVLKMFFRKGREMAEVRVIQQFWATDFSVSLYPTAAAAGEGPGMAPAEAYEAPMAEPV